LKQLDPRFGTAFAKGGPYFLETKKFGNDVYYEFATAVQFSAKGAKNEDILQEINFKQFQDGKQVGDSTVLEAFSIGKDGKALTIDPHVYAGDFNVKTDYKKLKIAFEFEVGTGLYGGALVKPPFQSFEKPDIHKFKFSDPKNK
jgi:hypothetical protein